MKLKDINIGTQLLLGLGALLVLMALLGGVAWFQTEQLWQETKGLYEHPLTVRGAVDKLIIGVLSMHRGMKDLVLAQDERERQSVMQEIDTCEAGAARQFDVLYDRYLGPRSNIDAARNAFVQWKSIREETIRLLRAGETTQAVNRTKSSGAGGAQVEKLLGRLQKISDFTLSWGDQFYADAQKQRSVLRGQLWILLGAIFLLILVARYLLLHGIKDPLTELTAAADDYRRGNLDARCQYVSANELGVLAASFNTIAKAMQIELRIKVNTALIADVMLVEEDPRAFCQALLRVLIQHTGSQIGAVYLLNDRKTDFEHFESIGLAAAGRASFSASGREGEFGAALATRQIQRLTDIPADTRFTFAIVGGDFQPREIITIPIPGKQEVVAVFSLASVRSYSAPAVRIVNDVWTVLTARLNGVLALQQIHAYSTKLENQNRELDAQKQELVVQRNELSEQNIELDWQKKQLDEASRLKSTFLSNMSHELRTPLNSVIALSGVLNRRLAGTIPAEEYSYLEVIERNGQNLLALINDILDLARIEAGREDLSLSRFSLRELTAEVAAMIEPQAREKNLALVNRVDGDLPPIRSDVAKCRHILQNLVGNAVKFTEKGAVEISAAVVDDTVQIAVTDTGIGIAADQLLYIFDEFRQADESMTKNYGGSGLGLSIASKYARLLHGRIVAASTPGQGSTFTLTLPLTIEAPLPGEPEAQETEYALPAKAGGPPPSPDGQGQCILVVEDSEPAVIQMRDILGGQGYRVRVARNGREALEQIDQIRPDAMILDLMMPEVDGFEVLRKIRGEETTARLPVLILTAKHVTREEIDFLQGNHIHQLIQKGGINKTGLLAAIGQMMAPRQVRQTPPARTPVQPRTAGRPTVLVVEDNPDSMLTVKALLRDTCTVIEAADGQAAVTLARMHMPDLILMDIALPGMDGLKALDAIRNEEALRHIPVIALTASAMKGNREEFLDYGFDGYIPKPIDGELLEKTIKEHLVL